MEYTDFCPEEDNSEPSLDDLQYKLDVINLSITRLKQQSEYAGNLQFSSKSSSLVTTKKFSEVIKHNISVTTCFQCGEEVAESEIRRHVRLFCSTLLVECPNSECKMKMQKSQMQHHLKEDCIRVTKTVELLDIFKTRRINAETRALMESQKKLAETVKAEQSSVIHVKESNDVVEENDTELVATSVVAVEFSCLNSALGCREKFTTLADLSRHLNVAASSSVDSICAVELSKFQMAEKGYTKRHTRVVCRACGQMTTLMALRRHEQEFCPNRYVPCKNWEFGCTRLLRCQDRMLHENVSKILSANIGGTVRLVGRKGTALITNMRTCLMFTNSGMIDFYLKYLFPEIHKKMIIQTYYSPSARIDISEGINIPCEGDVETGKEESQQHQGGLLSPPWTAEFWVHRGTYMQAAQLAIVRCLRLKYGLFDEHVRRERLALEYAKSLKATMDSISTDYSLIINLYDPLLSESQLNSSASLEYATRIMCILQRVEISESIAARLKLTWQECPSLQEYAAAIALSLVDALDLYEHQSLLTTLCGLVLWNDLQLAKSEIDNANSFGEPFPENFPVMDEVAQVTEWWMGMSWKERAYLITNDIYKTFPESMLSLAKQRTDMGINGGNVAKLMNFKEDQIEIQIDDEFKVDIEPKQNDEDDSDKKQNKKRKEKSAERRKRKKIERSETRNEKQSLTELIDSCCRGSFIIGGDILLGCVNGPNVTSLVDFCSSLGLNIPEALLSELTFACPSVDVDVSSSTMNYSFLSLQCGPEGKIGMKFNCGGWVTKIPAEENEEGEMGSKEATKYNFNHPSYIIFDYVCPRESWTHLAVSCTLLTSSSSDNSSLSDYRFSLYVDGRIVSSVKYSDFACSSAKPTPCLPLQFMGCPPIMGFKCSKKPDPLAPSAEEFDQTLRRRIAAGAIAARGLTGGTMIQEVRLWKLARKPKEVKEYFSEKLPDIPDAVQKEGLFLWWSLEDDYGSGKDLLVDNAELRCRSIIVDSFVDDSSESTRRNNAVSIFERQASEQRQATSKQPEAEIEQQQEEKDGSIETIQSNGFEWVYGEAEAGNPSQTMSFRMRNACLVEIKRAKLAQKGRRLLVMDHVCPLGCDVIMRKMDERFHVRHSCPRRLINCR